MDNLQHLKIEDLHSILVLQLGGLEQAVLHRDEKAVPMWRRRINAISDEIALKRKGQVR